MLSFIFSSALLLLQMLSEQKGSKEKCNLRSVPVQIKDMKLKKAQSASESQRHLKKISDLGTGRLKLYLNKNIDPSLSNTVKTSFHTLEDRLFSLCIMK